MLLMGAEAPIAQTQTDVMPLVCLYTTEKAASVYEAERGGSCDISVYLYITIWGCMYVSVCDVHLPPVVSSARVEHSGLSVQTLWHSTSETHILSERQRKRERKSVKVEKFSE